MPWDGDTISKLRELWNAKVEVGGRLQDKYSTKTIAGMMGFTKNAIVGKAHRLQLPARYDPIVRNGASQRPPPVRRAPVATTLPPLTTSATVNAIAEIRKIATFAPTDRNLPPRALTQEPPPARERVAPPPPPPREPAYRRPSTECSYPIGEPGRRGFRFCSDPTEPGKPYCLTHCRKCFVNYVPAEAA